MTEHTAENDAACPVPECSDGYVRVPVISERVMYGHTERFAAFEDFQCDECGGLGRVPRWSVLPPGRGAP